MPPRFFRHGELPLVLLALARQRPMHGYQLLNELAELFGPRYRPSPGTVYPAIEALETEGLVCADRTGQRTVYSITKQGAESLDDRAYLLHRLAQRTGVTLPEPDPDEPDPDEPGPNHPRSRKKPPTNKEEVAKAIDDFTARVAEVEDHIDPAILIDKLNQLADEIDDLAHGDDTYEYPEKNEENNVRPIRTSRRARARRA